MRRVQFSDVVQVEYDVTAEGFIENDKSNFSTFVGNRQNTLPGRHETKLSLGSMVQDSENSEAEDEPNDRRRMTSGERRQSRAAQLLMAPAKWAQQKECRQRKMSLHGKPIYYTAPSRRKSEVRKIMILIFNFLERPGGGNKLSVIYHIATFLFVCASLLLTVFATIPSHKNDAKRLLFVLEIILVTVFTIELIARLWSAGCRVRYQGVWGRLRFARKPFCIIDITVVLSSFVIILAGNENHTFAATAMRGLRFLQILRMVRVDRRGGTWKLLGSVVYAHSKELITAWYIGFLALIFASFLVYQAEKDLNPSEFGTFADALWWGLITLTTIGYGDKTPRSWIGRLIACSFAILGISFFALPAGILGSGFALKVQEQHRQKHLSRRRNPAAYVIQCFWRCYAADADSTSTATWREGLRGYISHNLSMKKNLIRDKRLPSASTVMDGNEKTSGYESTTNSDFVRSAIEKLQGRFSNSQIVRNSSIKRHFSTNEPETDDDWPGKSNDVPVTDLSDAQKNAIRGFRMMKFLVAKRKFKEALRPYDVKDVIEQYSSGHIDMLSRVKNLQSRVDCIVGTRAESSPVCGRPVSVSSRSAPNVTYGRKRSSRSQFDLCNRGLSMNERLAKVETHVMKVERKIDLLLRAFKNQEEFLRNRMISQANHIANPSFEEYGKREDKLGKSVPSYTQKSNLKKRANIASDSSENKEVSDSGSTSKFSNLRLRSPRLSRRKSSRQEPPKIMMNNDTDDDESEDVFLEDEDSDETYNGLFPIRESPHLPPSVNISETSESEDLNSIETPDEDTFDGKSEAYVISKEQMRIQLNGAHESDCDVFIKSGTENSENFATPNGVSINSTITQSYVKTRTSNDDKTSA